jgi:hypothetical protein
MLAPSSRFSKSDRTGTLLPRKTQVPLTFSGERSTSGHCDQSSKLTHYRADLRGAIRPFHLTQPRVLGRAHQSDPRAMIWKGRRESRSCCRFHLLSRTPVSGPEGRRLTPSFSIP